MPREVAKPDELLALDGVSAELFDLLRESFGVPDAVTIDLREVDSAVTELGDPLMIADLGAEDGSGDDEVPSEARWSSSCERAQPSSSSSSAIARKAAGTSRSSATASSSSSPSAPSSTSRATRSISTS